MSLFPLVAFVEIENGEADRALRASEHYLGPCERPFKVQSFGLLVNGQLAAVAVSASTVGATCAGLPRNEIVELARLGSLVGFRAWTRVAIRCWRELAPGVWPCWRVRACVSYSDETRHKGDVYRFDGWRKVAVMPGSGGGGTYSSKKNSTPKAVWIYPPEAAA